MTTPIIRYQMTSRIATGGMGEVWRAQDSVLGREVALKVLKSEYAGDPTFRARFETEARHAASLHHPNIATVFDYGENESEDGGAPRPYLVMELVEGRPLSELIRPDRPMAPEKVRDLLSQVAGALALAHANGIVHRDVKPANLLVTPDGQVKVTDFGIARAADGVALTSTGEVIGTPHYLSPEQAQGLPATPASDVYALGVVLFECLTGHRPFARDTPVATALAHVRDPVPDLPDDVPADLAALTRRALSKDPADRFPDAAAFATALAPGALTGSAPPGEATQVLAPPTAVLAPVRAAPPRTTPVTGPAEVGGRPNRRGLPRWWPVAALGLLTLVVVGFLLLRGGTADTPGSDTARIDAADFVGLTEQRATDRLHGLGFDDISTADRDNPGDRLKGHVAAISPRGNVRTDSTITLTLWGPKQAPKPPEQTPSSTPSENPSETPSEKPNKKPSKTPNKSPPVETPSVPVTGSPAAAGVPGAGRGSGQVTKQDTGKHE